MSETKKGERSRVYGVNVAVAPFLRFCPAVITLGIKPTISDYSQKERDLLFHAKRVFFPTPRFVDIFQALEKPSFPNATTHRYQRSRILQQLLFQYVDYPRPQTRIYFGAKQKQHILKDFSLPFLLMGPQSRPGTTYTINDHNGLKEIQLRYNPIIVQETFSYVERIRLLCVYFECLGAQRRQSMEAEEAQYEPIPLKHPILREPLKQTRKLLRSASLDDIVIEWGHDGDRWLVLGMIRPPVLWNMSDGTLHRHRYICELVENNIL